MLYTSGVRPLEPHVTDTSDLVNCHKVLLKRSIVKHRHLSILVILLID